MSGSLSINTQTSNAETTQIALTSHCFQGHFFMINFNLKLNVSLFLSFEESFCFLEKASVPWRKFLFFEETFCSGKKPSDLRRNWHVLFKNCTCYQCFCIVTLTQIHPSSPECLLLFMTGHFFRNHFVTGHVEWITCGKLAVQVTMEILCNLSDTRKFFDFELLHCDQWCRRQWQKQQHLAKTTMTTLFTRQKTAVAVFTEWTQTCQKKNISGWLFNSIWNSCKEHATQVAPTFSKHFHGTFGSRSEFLKEVAGPLHQHRLGPYPGMCHPPGPQRPVPPRPGSLCAARGCAAGLMHCS